MLNVFFNCVTPADLETATELIRQGNYPQAELHVRRYQHSGHADGLRIAGFLSQIASGYGLPSSFRLLEKKLVVEGNKKYLFIRAWGYGFWSDVHHLLGQLLVAELTQRIPIVWWGDNSLFRDESPANAFELFFQPISPVKLPENLVGLSIYPPKWNQENLQGGAINLWEGAYSRFAAHYLFGRTEDIVVSDFYTTISSIIPWISHQSAYYGLSDDQIYAHLYEKYLRPIPFINSKANVFYRQHMIGRPWVAIHVRGSDKIFESADLDSTNRQYLPFVDRIIELNPGIGIFLLTDSSPILDQYIARYGKRVLSIPALRTDSNIGLHLQGHSGYMLGEQVLVDVLLAIKCDYFIGNQESNVSLAISSMKRWPPNFIFLLGQHNVRADNWFLHKEHRVSLEKCRLCNSPVSLEFQQQILAKYNVGYYRCTGCGSLQTELPYWLSEAYSEQAEKFDTGKATRTLINFLALPDLLAILGIRHSDRALDFGAGTGLFSRLMRDLGYNFFAYDKFGAGEFAGSYQWKELVHSCRLVTIFEVVEHFSQPAGEWSEIFLLNPDFIIGSTSFFQGQGADWSYLSPESGQHVFFYSPQALAYLAARHGYSVYYFNMYFVFAKRPLAENILVQIRNWQDSLYKGCQNTFEQWLANPYGHAARDNAEVRTRTCLRNTGIKIAIDGVFFRFATGISRVWKSLLAEWSANGFGEFLVVIDRKRTAPRFPGIAYVDAPQHQYVDIPADQRLLQTICDREGIALFISTYYTTPVLTPTVMMVYDMIPEVVGFDLTNAQWLEKHRAIHHATKYLSISESTKRDLCRYFPTINPNNVVTTYCGCDFRPADAEAIARFKQKFGLDRPYFLISGVRDGYKNAILFFKAFARMGEQRREYAIVCTNSNYDLEPEMASCVGEARVHMTVLSDDELQCAYRGAIALVYPSRYEGFGLPVLEALACHCPVITCPVSSIPEVGGDAVLYVNPDDVEAMYQSLGIVQNEATRRRLVERGERRSTLFSWDRMEREVAQALSDWAIATKQKEESTP